MGASEWQIFYKVMLPSASSWIVTSLKMALPFSLIGVIIGEFMASSKGIGYRLNSFTTTYNITGAITLILIIMVLMTLLNAVMNKFEIQAAALASKFKCNRTGRAAVNGALASSSPTFWCHYRHSDLGRTASSIRPDMGHTGSFGVFS